MNLFELRGQHRSLIAKAETILNTVKAEGRELTPDEAKQVDGFLEQAKPVAVKIREVEDVNTILQFDPRAIATGAALVRRGEQDPAQAAAQSPIPRAVIHPKEAALKRQFSAWSRRMVGALTGMPAADNYTPEIEAANPSGAISTTTGTNLDSISFAIPVEILPFQKSYLSFAPFELAGASVINTPHMRSMNLPIISAGAPPANYAEGQGPAQGPTGSTPMGMSGFTFGANKYSRQVLADYEALMSTETPLQPAIVDELLAAMANVLTSKATSQLYAALTAPPNFTITGGVAPCQIGGSGVQLDNYGQLTALRHALPEGYEDENECCWMLSRNTLAIIRNTRASTSGVPMLDPEKDLILGRRYTTNEFFDSICGAGFVAYGNWRRGAWLRRTPILTRVLQELYWLNNQIGFLATSWCDNHFLAELVGATQPPTWQPIWFTVLPSGSQP